MKTDIFEQIRNNPLKPHWFLYTTYIIMKEVRILLTCIYMFHMILIIKSDICNRHAVFPVRYELDS
jgi:hypothetical protein